MKSGLAAMIYAVKAIRQAGVELNGRIGLTIVRKAVDRMGGHVGVESQVGSGSRFWIELKAPVSPQR